MLLLDDARRGEGRGVAGGRGCLRSVVPQHVLSFQQTGVEIERVMDPCRPFHTCLAASFPACAYDEICH